MSGVVELAFRQEVAERFRPELGGRVFDNAHPAEAALPLAMYRRIGAATRPVAYGETVNWLQARIQWTLKGESYSEVKRLQARMERFFASFSGLMGRAGGEECCPVRVHYVEVITLPDMREPNSRARLALSDYIIRYSE